MKLSNNKKLSLALPLILVAGVFIFGHNAAAASDWAVTIISGILGVFIWALGVILVLVIHGLILIASYQNFIGSAAVGLGWVIVRDICNMFFSVVLLIIAFGTILHIENYSYKKWLPKLILMAILINFSKTICGLMIDASQIVMLTFVNAFKDVGGANLTDILGISDIVTMAKDDADMSLWTVVGAYVLGIIYLLIAVVVIVTMMMMLVMRLVMIWIYVVLSPMAYLMSAFPGGQKYASEWWSEFTKNLVVGPVLAFFIWLSFAALQATTISSSATNEAANRELGAAGATATSGDNTSAALAGTKASSPEALIKFVIAIGMLLGGLKIAQEIGGSAGSLAGKGMARISKGAAFATGLGAGALVAARNKAWSGTKTGAKFVGRGAGTALGTVDRYIGAKVSGGKETTLSKRGLFAGSALTIAALPGKVPALMTKQFGGNKELNDAKRKHLAAVRAGDKNAVMEYNSKHYKQDEKTGSFYEVNKETGKMTPDNNGKANYLKTDKGKEVKAMDDKSAAWHDAWRNSGTQAKAISNKAQEEKISKIQGEMSASGMTPGEMSRKLMSSSTSATEKMALAMTMAMKGAFNSAEEVKEGKKYIGGNTVLAGKFNDEVDKNQSHLNYDLAIDDKGKYKNENDVNKFKMRIETGKIDATKLSQSTLKAFAAKDNGGLKALKEKFTSSYAGIMDANVKRGGQASLLISQAELNHRKLDGDKIATDDTGASMHANVTGKIEESFTVNGKIDTDALDKYLKGAKTTNLSKINMKSIDEADKVNPGYKKIIMESFAKNIDLKRLKALNRSGDNNELVEEIIKEAAASNTKLAKQIQADSELNPAASANQNTP